MRSVPKNFPRFMRHNTTANYSGDTVTITLKRSALNPAQERGPRVNKKKDSKLPKVVDPITPDLSTVRMKFLVQEINRRTQEDPDMVLQITEKGNLRAMLEYE